jgi:hypothetical protein
MSENLHCLPSGLPVVRLLAPDGASATVALHGGHVLSWVPAGGRECLYLSPRSGYAPGQAIRGGVPVIFPQFSDRGPLKRHGFARVVPWQLTQQSTADDAATALLRLDRQRADTGLLAARLCTGADGSRGWRQPVDRAALSQYRRCRIQLPGGLAQLLPGRRAGALLVGRPRRSPLPGRADAGGAAAGRRYRVRQGRPGPRVCRSVAGTAAPVPGR